MTVLDFELKKPCEGEIGPKEFLAWGPLWAYHFNSKGEWVEGRQVRDADLMGQHAGIDIICPIFTKVYAPCDMTILRAGSQGRYGNRVLAQAVKDPKPYLTFAHLSNWEVLPTYQLKEGDFFATTGCSGNVTAPHLHLQIEEQGEWPRKPMRPVFI